MKHTILWQSILYHKSTQNESITGVPRISHSLAHRSAKSRLMMQNNCRRCALFWAVPGAPLSFTAENMLIVDGCLSILGSCKMSCYQHRVSQKVKIILLLVHVIEYYYICWNQKENSMRNARQKAANFFIRQPPFRFSFSITLLSIFCNLHNWQGFVCGVWWLHQ